MNYRMIFNILGKIVCVEAAFMLPAMLIAWFSGDRSGALGFGAAICVSLLLGTLFMRLRGRNNRFFARDGFVTVGLTWIVVSALGALPFWISGAIPNYLDCLFETVSGFTTTGATILSDVEKLSPAMLYWRSFTHWLGGMGVLVFMMALSTLTKKNSGESMYLLRAESPGIRITKLAPRMRRSAMILYEIYIGLTLLQIALLLIGRMSLFDAVTLSFGTAGTGGFGVRNDSIASYSPYCQWVITAFMLVFSVNFNIYFLLLLRQFRKAAKNEELRLFLFIVLAATVLVAADTAGRYSDFAACLRAAAFQVSSIISTTGYSTVNFDLWPQVSRCVLVLLMFIGACAGSTGGGLKIVRLLVMGKAARRSVFRVLHPNSVCLIHMDGETLDEDTVHAVNTYTVLFCLIFAAAMLLMSFNGQSFETTFTAVAACINNVGPGLGAVGPNANFAGLSYFSKLVLTITMLIGRLEIYPILVLFTPTMWKR